MDPTLQAISQQTEIPLPPRPTRHPFHKKPMLLMSLFILIVIGAFFAGTYYQGMNTGKEIAQVAPSPTPSSPTPVSDPTAEWMTYLNTKVGFEVKYPARYSRPHLPSGLGPTVYADGEEDNANILFGDKSTDRILLQVFPFIGSLDDLVKYKKTPSLDGNTALTEMKTSIVAGQEARWYKAISPTVYSGDKGGAIKIYFLGKDHGFIVDANSDHNEQEIDQILKTFTFTNTNAGTLSSFTSTRCGIEAGYPKGWSAEESIAAESTGYPVSCIFLTAPDYKVTGLDSREGFWVNITSTKLGTVFNETTVQSLENFITATEKVISPVIPVKNKQTKKYGTISGTYFEWGGVEEMGNFIFLNKGSVVEVSWPLAYTGEYRADVSSIIASIKYSN